MRLLAILVLCTVVTATARAQTSGAIFGAVATGAELVPGAPVQATEQTSGAVFRTVSSANGEYSLEQLPAGDYQLSVAMPGFRFQRFVQPNVVVGADRRVRADIDLRISNLDTLGDDPFTYLAHIRAQAADLTGPVPRTPDGKPDLSGVWNGNDDLFPQNPELMPWAAAVVQQRVANDFHDLPRGLCLPAGVVPVGPFFRKFVQTPELLVILNEDEVLGFRQIFLDGRDHPQELEPTWNGHAIGRWEGDTLVVDVVGFNDKSVLVIVPHTEQLRITERYRRRDFGHMEVTVTAEDPGTLTKPWTFNMAWDLAPSQELLEYVCTESVLNMHLEWREDFKEYYGVPAR